MAVKVGNSWVSEAALSYAKVKADSGESATLNGLLDRYPGVNFSTNTQAFSQKGTNNIQIAPIILAQMQNNPDKRIEYEALIYDCAKLISSGAMDWARQQKLDYVVAGSVEEWQYKNGLDGEPAVGISLQVLRPSSGQVLWSSSGARAGWSRESLSGAAQKVLDELVGELEIE